MSQRVLSVVSRLLMGLVAAAIITVPVGPVLAQQTSDKPAADQQQPSAASRDAAKVEEFVEAQHELTGPAGNPECVRLGRQVVALLWNNDIDTAFRHLDLYDRFGCPAAHIQAAFRCILLHPPASDPKPTDPNLLEGRAHACWVNPSLASAPTPAVAPAAAAPSATTTH
ncbi:MAG: beta-1-3, beta-1-6-glucan biosynthesis protein [Xanthobacteraceae bacterium]